MKKIENSFFLFIDKFLFRMTESLKLTFSHVHPETTRDALLEIYCDDIEKLYTAFNELYPKLIESLKIKFPKAVCRADHWRQTRKSGFCNTVSFDEWVSDQACSDPHYGNPGAHYTYQQSHIGQMELKITALNQAYWKCESLQKSLEKEEKEKKERQQQLRLKFKQTSYELAKLEDDLVKAKCDLTKARINHKKAKLESYEAYVFYEEIEKKNIDKVNEIQCKWEKAYYARKSVISEFVLHF